MEEQQVIREIDYKAVRSSGAGGQHVNKVSSKVEIHFNLEESSALSGYEKARLRRKFQTKLTQKGEIILQCGESRSQHKNREIVTERLLAMLKEGLKKKKVRKKTKLPKAAKLKRLREKQKQSEKKAGRKDPLKE